MYHETDIENKKMEIPVKEPDKIMYDTFCLGKNKTKQNFDVSYFPVYCCSSSDISSTDVFKKVFF